MSYVHKLKINDDEWTLKEDEAAGFTETLARMITNGNGQGLLEVSDGTLVVKYLINATTRFEYRQEPDYDVADTIG